MAEAKKLIDLSKKVKINLAKVTSMKIRAQVGATFDVSVSAQGMYARDGIMQRLCDRLFAVAYEFDDNGSLDAWAFHTQAWELESITEKMFGSYVQKHIVEEHKHKIYGGTAYFPAFEMIVDHYYPAGSAAVNVTRAATTAAVAEVKDAATGLFGKVKSLFGSKPAAPVPAPAPVAAPARATFSPKAAAVKLPDPAYILFVSDGETSHSDEARVRKLLTEHADKQIYWQLVGITDGGRPDFSVMERLSKEFPNVGFYNAGLVDNVSDDDLYSSLFTKKFITWYEKAKAL